MTACRGGDTVERFVEFGQLSPAFMPFYGASDITITGEGTFTPSSTTRGALTTFPVLVTRHDVFRVQYASGIVRPGVKT